MNNHSKRMGTSGTLQGKPYNKQVGALLVCNLEPSTASRDIDNTAHPSRHPYVSLTGKWRHTWFLVVVLHRLADSVMNDETHIWLVDTCMTTQKIGVRTTIRLANSQKLIWLWTLLRIFDCRLTTDFSWKGCLLYFTEDCAVRYIARAVSRQLTHSKSDGGDNDIYLAHPP